MKVSKDAEQGFGGAKLYRIWTGMRKRCNNPNCTNYTGYGAKGIRVCEEWETFKAFRQWAETSGYVDGLTIDRRNGSDGYSPDNCRWATIQQQGCNVRKKPGRHAFRGVEYSSKQRFAARIRVCNRSRFIGVFKTRLAAALAYDAAAQELHGEFAILNFPERYRSKAASI